MVRRAKFLPGYFAALVIFSPLAIAWAVPGKSMPAGAPKPAQVPSIASAIGVRPQGSPAQGALPGFADAAANHSVSSPLDYRTAQQAVFSLQRDIARVSSELAGIHDAELSGLPVGLAPRKRALQAGLESLLRSVSPRDFQPERAKFPEVKVWLEHLRGERDRLLDEMRERTRAGRIEEMESAADELLAVNGEVLRFQLLSARLMLGGASGLPSKPMRRNAALKALGGAFHSAAAQNAELAYQLRRTSIREIAPIPGGGVRVRRWAWINAHSKLEKAARDLRNGRLEECLREIADLADIYGRDPSFENYADIAAKLLGMKERIGAGNEAAGLSWELLALSGRISHPRIKVLRVFDLPDGETARRSYTHELESIGKQQSLLLRHMARLEYFQDILHAAANGARGALPIGERRKMIADLDVLREWAEKGFVQEKQAAEELLNQAVSNLSSLARMSRSREHDLPRRKILARVLQNVAAARRELSQRLNELERISRRVRTSLAVLEVSRAEP